MHFYFDSQYFAIIVIQVVKNYYQTIKMALDSKMESFVKYQIMWFE